MRRKRGFTLVELLVVIAIIALLIAILLPSLSRAKEISKRTVCLTNLKALGTASEMYSNDNKGKWMTPAHSQVKNPIPPTPGQSVIVWQRRMGGHSGAGSVDQESRRSLWGVGVSSLELAKEIPVSRSLYQLVREARTAPKQMICPSAAGDFPDRLLGYEGAVVGDIRLREHHAPDFFYDFEGYDNLSYGYQVPFGSGNEAQCRAGSNADSRLVVMADKGPFARASVANANEAGGVDIALSVEGVYSAVNNELKDLEPEFPPDRWRRGNSPNHGGRGNGEGQNVYKMDGSATFQKKPCVGIDNDNIYLRQGGEVSADVDNWDPTPWRGNIDMYPPGLYSIELVAGVFGNGTTDSYVWP